MREGDKAGNVVVAGIAGVVLRSGQFCGRGRFWRRVLRRTVRSAGVLSATAGLVLSAPVLAFQPLITDDTGVQGAGGNQVEFAYVGQRTHAPGVNEKLHERFDALPFVFTRGVTDSLDLFGGVAAVRERHRGAGRDVGGVSNVVVGAKWRFFDDAALGTSLALKPEIFLPVSDKREDAGLGMGKTSYALTFIVTQVVSFGAVHFNIRPSRDRYRDTQANPDNTGLRFSLAPVWDVSEQWKLALDVGTIGDRSQGNTVRTNYGELGAIYSPNKDVDLSAGYLHSRDDDHHSTVSKLFTVGVTWRFR